MNRFSIRRAVLSLSLILAFAGCSERERNNPFDPLNPDPVRANVGFNALAGNNAVFLQWDQLKFDDLSGIRILRSSNSGPDTVALNDTILPPSQTNYADYKVENGVTYTYWLQFALKGDSERPETRPDIATPGPVYGWMAVEEGTAVTMMTPDFRDERYRLDATFYGIQDIQVNTDNTEVWVLDSFTGEIIRFRSDGETLEQPSGLGQVGAFCFNYADNTVWIGVKGYNSLLYHFSNSGALLKSYSLDLTPTSISCGSESGNVAVGSEEGMIVYLENNNVHQISHSDFMLPEKVAIGRSYSAPIWVLDTGSRMLFLFKLDNLIWSSKIFADPMDMAINFDGDVCWVADEGSDMLYEINDQGKVTANITGLGNPRYVSYDSYTGTVYVTGASGLITNIYPGGHINWQIKKSNQPGKISFPGPGH